MRTQIGHLSEIIKEYDKWDTFSFDVFDTLVFRRAEDHFVRDLEICKRQTKYINDVLDIKINEYTLKDERDIAFKLSKKKTGDEVDYVDACSILLTRITGSNNFNSECIDTLLNIEEEYELEIAYPNQEAIQCLQELKRQGKRCIAISDMYLPSSSVRSILKKCNLLDHLDNVYCSSDSGYTKASGKIFEYLIQAEIINKDRTFHIGDNYVSDFLNASNNGIYACHYMNVENESRKRRLAFEKKRDIYNYERCGGISIGSIIANLIYSFLLDLYQYARKNNIREIYFCTRDSSQLKDKFKDICEKNDYTMQVRILHTDRRSAYLTNCHNSLSLLQKPFLWNMYKTIGEWVQSIGLEDYAINNIGYYSGLKNCDLHISLTSKLYDDFFMAVLNEFRCRFFEYLKRVNFFGIERKIVVDIGYSGTTIRELSRNKYIERNELGIVDCFLFASNRHLLENADLINSPFILHVPKILPNSRLHKLCSASFSWLEPWLIDSSMGPLCGYDNKYLPIRSYSKVTTVFNKYIEPAIDALVAKNENIDLDYWISCLNGSISAPSKKQMLELLGLKHNKNLTNDASEDIVKKVSIFNIRRQVKELILGDFWIGGSLRYSGFGVFLRFLVRHFDQIRSIRK